MQYLDTQNGSYQTSPATISPLAKMLPSLLFYLKFIGVVVDASIKARRREYSAAVWAQDSLRVLRLLESVGVKIHVSGFTNLKNLTGPCVFASNHMSMMETVILPVIILPYTKVTYVVKQSLLTYPVFKHVMISTRPVAVTRTHPRQDFKTVMTQGAQRLAHGTSIIVFPQTTRSTDFDPTRFGSIGVKLAKKANVPVIPVALKTDAWQNGKYSKDFGRLQPNNPVKIAFGEAVQITGKGSEEHDRIVEFIERKLGQWQ